MFQPLLALSRIFIGCILELDHAIDPCAKHGIPTILTLPAAASRGQNTDWHADAGTCITKLWSHKDLQYRRIYENKRDSSEWR